jgi:ATP-dependent protease HslVU (ClpYQ) peptidase subunit
MTTIAYKDGIIAADTRICFGNIKHYCRKIHKLDNGIVLAIAGKLKEEGPLLDYYKGLNKRLPRRFSSLEAMKVEDGEITWINNNPYWQPMVTKFYALGSGWEIAMAGMIIGLSAKDAVLLAADLDVNTNKYVDTYNIKTKRLTLCPFPNNA